MRSPSADFQEEGHQIRCHAGALAMSWNLRDEEGAANQLNEITILVEDGLERAQHFLVMDDKRSASSVLISLNWGLDYVKERTAELDGWNPQVVRIQHLTESFDATAQRVEE